MDISLNYYLSVVPFLAAVDTRVIHQGSFQIVQRNTLRSDSTQCFIQVSDAMKQWRNFFTSPLQSNSCHVCNICEIKDWCYLGPLWSTYNESVNNALPIIQPKLSLLSSLNEQQFGLSWVDVLSLVGMAPKNSDLIATNDYPNMYTPNRMLKEDDKPPHCKYLSETVNLSLKFMFEVQIESYPDLSFQWGDVTGCYEQRKLPQMALEMVPFSKSVTLIYYDLAVFATIDC